MPSIAGSSSPGTAGPLERIGRIAEVIEEAGAANEKLGQLIPEVVEKLHEQRLFRMLLPRVYGGDQIDPVTWFRAMEALAKRDASTAWCVGQINGCTLASSALAPEVARAMWGEPRSVLSWGPPAKARADQVDGGHRHHRPMEHGERQPARDLARPDGAGVRRRRRAGAAARRRQHAHFLRAGRVGRVGRQLERLRADRHQQRRLQVREPVRPRRLLHEPRAPRRGAASRSALQVSVECAVCHRLLGRRARHRPLHAGCGRRAGQGKRNRGCRSSHCWRATSSSSRSGRPRRACGRPAATSNPPPAAYGRRWWRRAS